MKNRFSLAKPLLFCALCTVAALALEQRAALVVGYPDAVDLGYGISGPYGGIEVSTGIVALAFTQIKDDDMFTLVWNPSVGVSKRIPLAPWLYVKPKVSAMYYAGEGYEEATGGFNYLRLRFDRLYFIESLGLGFDHKSWFLEVSPAVIQFREFTIELENKGHVPVRHNAKYEPAPFGLSLSIGKFF